MSKKDLINYDLNILPEGLPVEDMLDIAEKTNFLFYDSFLATTRGCKNPYPYLFEGGQTDKIMIDISTEKGKVIYDRILKEMEDGK